MTTRPQPLMGSIVAFEGKSDLVLTQLRLLPTSPQLLILPSVESYIKSGDQDQDHCFDARCFVRQIHNALVARNNAARDFLDGSTADHKRLVFLSGGTPGAQALCVQEIMKHDTDGDKAEAEAIFEEIVKDGLAGLEKQISDRAMRDRNAFGYAGAMDDAGILEEDPITRAMRAADALDRQTANLQPSNDLHLSLASRPRSSSLPLYGFFDELDDSTPFYVFGARQNEEESNAGDAMESLSAPPTPGAVTSYVQEKTLDKPRLSIIIPFSTPNYYPASCMGEAYEPKSTGHLADATAISPKSEAFSILSTDHIVYGEASVLDIRRSVGRNSIARVKSLDRIYPSSPKFRDLGIPSVSWLEEPDTPRALQHPQATPWLSDDKGRRFSCMGVMERPRTVLVRSRLSTVAMEPVPVERKKKKTREVIDSVNPNYVDRGTDARQSLAKDMGFQPVLPLVEDLVVFFKDESSDILLESAVHAFKNRRYPLLSYSPAASDLENIDTLPGTPSQLSPKSGEKMDIGLKEPDMVSPGADDYDPFAYTQPVWQPPKSLQLVSTVSIVRPPTPAHTPPPTTAGYHEYNNEYKVHEFDMTLGQTAVSVQNSLRSILGEYFPPDTEGYRQFQFSLLPEFDELWKPMFRGGEPGSPQKDDSNGTQILAIGSQKGVQKEYSSAVTGRLEKVGRKSCEIVKTGRVDFRYLLANAMQAFTAQRLANQTDNPFTNSYLLATLIIPHLETYLALHTDVRYLLLLYPPEHLATVLALQKLIGIDVMKVAQIVDSKSKEDSPFKHIRGASINSKSESKSARTPFSSRSSSEVAVSKANYLLTSTASEKDIATFVSTVWNIDIEEPEAPVDEQWTEKPKKKKPPPLSMKKDQMSEIPKPSAQSPASPKSASVSPPSSHNAAVPVPPIPAPAPDSAPPTSPAVSLRAPSLAGTIKTLKSIKSKRSLTKLRNKSAPQTETESPTGLDFIDDSDDDLDERRLMPVFMQKRVIRKPNSRKALKFLGLA
ncbi:hypothetical protein QQS21_009343 [Conoideocrella luteorostrata]|uniref:Gastric mucin-like protein n=1 Tax=Conoideocrella luteorostrata TaxID=1105319 RepID=A0AAJ0CH52_9HYPO|nr:hypothetical protein QQS21_009343 [Conoideocrella luteorostrata]